MWKKNWETKKKKMIFSLNILNEAECLVCAQIKRKKCEYSLTRYYRTCHTKLHSIMSCEESALATYIADDSFLNSGTWIFQRAVF